MRWFHSGGIFASLSETTAELVIEAMKAAKAAGVICSFDLNYREKLWKTQGGMERAHEVLGAIVDNVDVLVGNEEDLQKGLGFAGAGGGEREAASRSWIRACSCDDREGGGSGFRTSRLLRRRCARCTPRTTTAGARWHG